MKKHGGILFFFLLNFHVFHAQNTDQVYEQVDKCIQEYMQLSRLGPGYSREISQDIIDQFKTHFERDAFLYWDLYKSDSDSLYPPLTFNEYIDLAKKKYNLKQPLLDYSAVKITVQKNHKYASIYLKKTNQILNAEDKPLHKNQIDLRINMSLDKDRPLIQNIFEVKRHTLFRGISIDFNYVPWSSVFTALASEPGIPVGPDEQYKETELTTGIALLIGLLVEMRLNKNKRNGLSLSAGITYSQLPVFTSVNEYAKKTPDTLDEKSVNPFTCTTFERSPEMKEKIVLTKFEMPLLLTVHLSNWAYLKAGPAISCITGTSEVHYMVSRTGGGLSTNLRTLEHLFIDIDHELDQSNYGYYRDKWYSFPGDFFLRKICLSFQFAAGFEKQFSNFSIGLEPNMSIGMNPLYNCSLPGNYQVDNEKFFISVLESSKMPAFEVSAGIRFIISYLFKK